MKRVLLIFLCALFLSALDSCGGKKTVADDEDIIVIDVPLEETMDSEIAKRSVLFDIEEIQLETAGLESLVGEIRDIKYCDDTLIILSDQTFMLFDMQGRFIRKINRKGRGRGEYISLSSFEIDEVNHHIVCTGNFDYQIYRYTFDGTFVSKTEAGFSFLNFALLPDGDFVFFTPFSHNDPNGLWLTDADFNIKSRLVPLVDYNVNSYAGGSPLVHVNDSVVGYMGVDNDNRFYHVVGDTAIPVYRLVSEAFEMKEGVYENLPPFYKMFYCESDELLIFTLNMMDNSLRYVRTFYDKRTGKTSYLFRRSYTFDDDDDRKIPDFYCYKGCFFRSVTKGQDSNPAILIYRSKPM